ncbi:MAG: hypothetical protein ACRDNY_12885 [Gaiellaceae bacterium]
MSRRLAGALLRASGLPSLGPVLPCREEELRFASAAEGLLHRSGAPSDIPLLTLLRWTAERHAVVFHGSTRDDLTTLEPIRLTRDSTTFGDRAAVYASSDPVWAIYFATVQRGGGFRSTRNASIGLRGALYPRWYFFSHNEDAETEGRFGDGWLYALPRATFEPEPPGWGVLDWGHWASPTPVTALARIRVSAAVFPFADRVFPHRIDERMLTTLLGASRFRSLLAVRRARVAPR